MKSVTAFVVKLLVDIRGNMLFFLLFLLSAEVAARATRGREHTRQEPQELPCSGGERVSGSKNPEEYTAPFRI